MANSRTQAKYRVGMNVTIIDSNKHGTVLSKRSEHFTFFYKISMLDEPSVEVPESNLKRSPHSDNSKFKRGSGVYTCTQCGKQTRDTGHGEASLGYCRHCKEMLEWCNVIQDGGTLEDIPEEFRADVSEELGL